MASCCQAIGQTLLKTKFCAHCFFFYSFAAFDGSKGTIAGSVVSPRSIMANHGFRSKEVRRFIKQNIVYSKQHHTPHCWFSVKVMYPANPVKRISWLTRSTPICIVVERSNIYIYLFLTEISLKNHVNVPCRKISFKIYFALRIPLSLEHWESSSPGESNQVI